ncbi:1,2-dihydroxy-3-keto-5-methylthiopentene dioxygenase-like protein [Aphelenchoides bicaudatus]|nr:1,2-dihydroxy-3-keto-5-methylthiopentene dioxygenase-like protein [Aphelenchoides bicaudatus]
MLVWQMESYPIGDRRLPHSCFPPKNLTVDQLQQKLGVVYYKVDLDDTAATKKRLSRLNSKKSDILTIDENVVGLKQMLEDLYKPQECTKEEMICMVLEGSMYCDVEIEEEEWVRIQLERGDLIIVPKGKAYRYTTTPKNFVRLQRFAQRSETQG